MGGKGSGRKKKGAEDASARAAWNEAAAAANGETKKGAQGRLALDADTEQIRTEREILVPLSESEHAFVSSQVIDVQVRIAALEAEVEEYVKPRRKEIAKLEKDSAKLVKEAHAKARHVVVPCREVHIFRTREVQVYRLDVGDPEIGELIETRAMTADELDKATFEPPEGPRIDLDDDDENAPPEDAPH